jgi:hypothetical protein
MRGRIELTPAKSKESLGALYDLTVQRVLDASVVSDLEDQLNESCVACKRLTISIANRVERMSCYKESGRDLSDGQCKMHANEKLFVMWFKQHNARIRAKVVEIWATL